LFFIVNVDTQEEMNVDMVLNERVEFNARDAVEIKPLFCFLDHLKVIFGFCDKGGRRRRREFFFLMLQVHQVDTQIHQTSNK